MIQSDCQTVMPRPMNRCWIMRPESPCEACRRLMSEGRTSSDERGLHRAPGNECTKKGEPSAAATPARGSASGTTRAEQRVSTQQRERTQLHCWDAGAERGATPAAAASKEDRRKETQRLVITGECPDKDGAQVPGAWGAFRPSGQRKGDEITPGDQFTLKRAGLHAGDQPRVYLSLLPRLHVSCCDQFAFPMPRCRGSFQATVKQACDLCYL